MAMPKRKKMKRSSSLSKTKQHCGYVRAYFTGAKPLVY